MIKIKQSESIFYNFSESDVNVSLLDYEGFYEIKTKTDDALVISGTLSKSDDNKQLFLRITYSDTETIDIGTDYVLLVYVQNSDTGYKDYIMVEDLIITKIY